MGFLVRNDLGYDMLYDIIASFKVYLVVSSILYIDHCCDDLCVPCKKIVLVGIIVRIKE